MMIHKNKAINKARKKKEIDDDGMGDKARKQRDGQRRFQSTALC
jgi:hypothetical protein